MVHLYKTRKVPRWSWHREPGESKDYVYKRFCDKERVSQADDSGFTSVPHNVTCPACLALLIPPLENKLNKMKSALEQATNERSAQPQPN